MTLADFLAGIVGGGLSYPVANGLYQFIEQQWGLPPSPANKRWIAFAISLALAVVALALTQALGYGEVTPDTVFTAIVTAITTGQAIHGAIALPRRAT